MAGLVPAITIQAARPCLPDRDRRDKPGDDGKFDTAPAMQTGRAAHRYQPPSNHEPAMSRAFVKEQDGDTPEALPDRPISPHPNLVTRAGPRRASRPSWPRLEPRMPPPSSGERHRGDRPRRRATCATGARAAPAPSWSTPPPDAEKVQFGATVDYRARRRPPADLPHRRRGRGRPRAGHALLCFAAGARAVREGIMGDVVAAGDGEAEILGIG